LVITTLDISLNYRN